MTQLAQHAGPPPVKAAPAADRLGIFSWCLYDWANSAFSTVIGTFVISVYFARSIYGDATAGASAWGYAIGISGLVVAILSPFLGAIADHAGRRKPWIGVFVTLTILPTALLWYAEPDRSFVLFTLMTVGLANVAFELAGVFYNAMLPDIAPRPYLGRVSGWAWGLGYAGGLTCLAIALFGFTGLDGDSAGFLGLPEENSENVRATAPLVAIWFAVFSLPLFFLTRDEPDSGLSIRTSIRRGISTLIATLKRARDYGQIVRFLIASALYRDGLTTLFAMGGVYASVAFGMELSEILKFAIGLNVTAGLGAAGFAWLDDGRGSKPTVLVALVGLVLFAIPLLLVTDAQTFIYLALGLGIFVGPAQAASRSLMARLSPKDMETEMFGLYAMTGKSAAFFGPVIFSTVTAISGSVRLGMSTIVIFWIAGGLLLLAVKEPGSSEAQA